MGLPTAAKHLGQVACMSINDTELQAGWVKLMMKKEIHLQEPVLQLHSLRLVAADHLQWLEAESLLLTAQHTELLFIPLISSDMLALLMLSGDDFICSLHWGTSLLLLLPCLFTSMPLILTFNTCILLHRKMPWLKVFFWLPGLLAGSSWLIIKHRDCRLHHNA